jgi:hypothetical protein
MNKKIWGHSLQGVVIQGAAHSGVQVWGVDFWVHRLGYGYFGVRGSFWGAYIWAPLLKEHDMVHIYDTHAYITM